jgi:hypothetical protein
MRSFSSINKQVDNIGIAFTFPDKKLTDIYVTVYELTTLFLCDCPAFVHFKIVLSSPQFWSTYKFREMLFIYKLMHDDNLLRLE